MADGRIDQQIAFLVEADKLKGVDRSNVLMDNSRSENSAEHAWHVCLWALVLAPAQISLSRVLRMLLLHDIVEIDAGDHPIHLPSETQDAAERAAADRLFGLLPQDQADKLRVLWEEFEAGETEDARFAKVMDHCQPILQTLDSHLPLAEHVAIVRSNLQNGRAADLAHRWPAGHSAIFARLDGAPVPDTDLAARFTFLAEADRLKYVNRASYIFECIRRENSAEHSWHVSLFAMVLEEHAHAPVDIDRVILMLLLHDLVEIDAGDNPLYGHRDVEAIEAQEQAAADRLFGLLPKEDAVRWRSIWEEFEDLQTPEAVFAKSMDRFQPMIQNLSTGGKNWKDYDVTLDLVVGHGAPPVAKGAPALWAFAKPEIEAYFENVKSPV